ncbi:MAG: pyridoxamine 5'-phosphate oxidase [Planctomycetota bacterium]
MTDFEALHKEFEGEPLQEASAGGDPMALFAHWWDEAVRTNDGSDYLPEAMTLATASPGGQPDARIVLLKDFDANGFVFYTNYASQKGRQLEANPQAAAVIYWPWLHRQVRIRGRVRQVAPEISEAYFATRPRGSQIGAWASTQSQTLRDRETLEQRVAEVQRQYEGQDVPRPAHWGGYRIRPDEIEFWQGRPDRLHDRLRYVHSPGGEWNLQRLSP